MVLLIPEGVVFLLCGLLQHLRECLSNKRHGLLKAIEGVAKALIAVANLCLLYYTNAPISEDLMLTISDQNHGSHTDLKVKVSHLILVQQL